MKHSKADSFSIGDVGQELVARELRARGFLTLSSASYVSGSKAPMLKGGKDSLIAPDLLVAKSLLVNGKPDGRSHWAEVKTKTTCGWRKDRNRAEHGLEARHYEQYLLVQEVTGLTVVVFVLELDTLQVLSQQLSLLDVSFAKNNLCYFPRACMRHFADIKKEDAVRQIEKFVTDKSKRGNILSQLGNKTEKNVQGR